MHNTVSQKQNAQARSWHQGKCESKRMGAISAISNQESEELLLEAVSGLQMKEHTSRVKLDHRTGVERVWTGNADDIGDTCDWFGSSITPECK